jgi:hypothetical protein
MPSYQRDRTSTLCVIRASGDIPSIVDVASISGIAGEELNEGPEPFIVFAFCAF